MHSQFLEHLLLLGVSILTAASLSLITLHNTGQLCRAQG
jgi:hypothetical protein